jgi:TPR repeat protein
MQNLAGDDGFLRGKTMVKISWLRKKGARIILVSIPVLFPLFANAQVGFDGNDAISNFCTTQNWETPNMQRRLKKMPRQERMEIYANLEFTAAEKRCLMRTKAAPVVLCDKVIEQYFALQKQNASGGSAHFQELTSNEENKVEEAFENSQCKHNADSNDADWLPEDLKHSASTVELLSRAKKGERTAQLLARELYTNGKDVPRNEERANFWLRQAAIDGDANSQRKMGWKYYVGKSPYQVNFEQAIRFLTLAANQGDRNAMTLLGTVYQQDEPNYGKTKYRKNLSQSTSWFVKAANLGDPQAAACLARIHESGNGVPVDIVKAFSWYQKSAENRSAESMLKLSELYQSGKGVAKNGETAQLWRRKADALGVNGATVHLKEYFPWGEMPSDVVKVAAIQLKHAAAGNVDAQLAIAIRYFYGDGVEQDRTIATRWWREAALAGDPIGQRMLGKSLKNGWDPTKKESESAGFPWIEKAAAQGDTEAQVMLAYRNAGGGATENSEVRKRNVLESVRLMHQAAERGYAPEDTRERADMWMRQFQSDHSGR